MEVCDVKAPNFKTLEYGAAYPGLTSFPGYKLSLDQPINHQFHRRFWTSDNADQDTYNYALTYTSEAIASTIYFRSYKIALSEYEPIPEGTEDPENAGAFLIHQEMKGLSEEIAPEEANLYRKVYRVYQVLPGPFTYQYVLDVDSAILTVATRKNLRANIHPGDAIVGDQWIRNTAKEDSVVVTNEIVTSRVVPGNPIPSTALRSGLIVSVIKTLIVAGSGVSQDSVVGGAEIQHWVEKHEESDQVQWQIDAPANAFPPQCGQKYDAELDVVTAFTQQTIGNQTTEPISLTDRLNIEPDNYALMTTRTEPTPNVAYGAVDSSNFYRAMRGTANIDFPPVLTELVCLYVSSLGSSSSSGSGESSTSGSEYYLSLEDNNANEVSAATIPQIVPKVIYYWGRDKGVDDLFFFLKGPSVSDADILAACSAIMTIVRGTATTVNPWLNYDPQEVRVALSSQKVNNRAGVRANISSSSSSSGSSAGYAKSTEISENIDDGVRIETIPPTLHAAPTLTGYMGGPTDSYGFNVIIEASIDWSLQVVNPGTVDTGPITGSVIGTIATLLSDATNVTAHPTSGLYLFKQDCDNYRGGLISVRARIFDYATLTS